MQLWKACIDKVCLYHEIDDDHHNTGKGGASKIIGDQSTLTSEGVPIFKMNFLKI